MSGWQQRASVRSSTISNTHPNPGCGKSLLLAAASAGCLLGTLASAPPVQADPLEWENSGSGDWNGSRARLADRGFTFSLDEEMIASYNVSGGIKTGSAASSRMAAFVNWELGSVRTTVSLGQGTDQC